jgi:hypothetical protein
MRARAAGGEAGAAGVLEAAGLAEVAEFSRARIKAVSKVDRVAGREEVRVGFKAVA